MKVAALLRDNSRLYDSGSGMESNGMTDSSQGNMAPVAVSDATSSVQMNGSNMSHADSVMMSVSDGVVSSSAAASSLTNTSGVTMSNGLSVTSSGLTMSSGNLFGKGSVKAPTCKVCGDESSGFHYGVDSCEGCKGFFRRCITQGMTHKCSNEEKCEITPFTRNSCQYCRLKKCFAVGMSREASRLGRRPKRLKDSGGESRHHHTTNLPIAPYPTNTSDLQKLRMAELQRLLQQNGTFKADLMQAFLQAAQVSFREHQRNHNTTSNSNQQSNLLEDSLKAGVTGASNGVNVVNNSVENGHRVQGNESGYSSLSSPSSSKSQSPVTSENAQSVGNGDGNLANNAMIIDSKKMLGMVNPNNMTTANLSALQQQANFEDIEKIAMNIKAEPGTNLSRCSVSEHPNIEISNEFLSSITDKMFTDPSFMSNIEQFMPGDTKLEPESPSSSSSNPLPGDSADSIDENLEIGELRVDTDKILSEVRQSPSELRKTLIEQVTESVVEAHFNTCNPTYQAVADANQHYMEMMASKEMPDFTKLIIEPNTVWQQFTKAMVPEITLVVKFCKKIPGFSEIEQDDQINLIKQGSFEVMLCRFCNLVDTAKGEMMDPTMKYKCPRDVVKKMPMGHFLEEFFKVAERFNPLKLTDGEIGLFTSVLIICPERSGIVNERAVRKLQSLLFQSFYLLVKRNHYDYDNIFLKVLGMISVFRKINKKHQAALSNMKMSMPEATNMFPALHQEVFDHNT